ncbi:unnamed protein product [Linum trigynum]|uniref:Uncharacterized protein n=1 Tax=Linum trigynum TaxID=586398 RepID=A0AAV2FZN3_9ROSI
MWQILIGLCMGLLTTRLLTGSAPGKQAKIKGRCGSIRKLGVSPPPKPAAAGIDGNFAGRCQLLVAGYSFNREPPAEPLMWGRGRYSFNREPLMNARFLWFRDAGE